MNCNIIMDLLPLYADGCCSDESKVLIEKHLENCKTCKEVLDAMNKDYINSKPVCGAPVKISKINHFKVSLVQTLSMFLSFLAIVLGVYLESVTPSGIANGHWTYMIIVPATAMLLSVANWYFVRVYKSRKVFSVMSALITALFAVCGYVWAIFHYGNLYASYMQLFIGIGVTVILCILSKVISSLYAKALGKE